ncbi:MAG: ATP-binding cassette domain-containing protein [Desulfurococcales archaeon]|nr:ATP-binding cassette domain-containing protein [Desulfurococcales archaeon]
MKLKIRGVKVQLQGREIIKHATLELSEGEAVVVAGPSGSGKTTFLRVISGAIPNIFGGFVKGLIHPDLETRVKAIGYLPQEPWFGIATPYVWSEIASFSNCITDKEIEAHLTQYGLQPLKDRSTYTLSAGETQRLAIAAAEASGKELLLLDEPTSHLDLENSLRVKDAVKSLLKEGRSALIIDHNPSFWDGLASEIYALVGGELRAYTPEIYAEPEERLEVLEPPNPKGGAVLEVRIASFRHPGSEKEVLRNVSFTVEEGGVTVVIGPSGIGKSTLLKVIVSAVRYGRTFVKASGKILYIPDNPLLYFTAPTLLKEVGSNGFDLLKRFGLEKAASTPIGRLSSGERRRGAIASALGRGASVVLMDEPTIGLDPLNKVEVLEAIREAAELGTGFLIATHDPDVLRIANEVIRL